MKKSELIEELRVQDLRPNTMSFYVDPEGNEQSDTSFGTCDLSGIRGDLVDCTALNSKDEVVTFQAGTWLVHGHLGKLAGAF